MDYVIITPVKNEEEFITQTIESVVSQTIKPSQWLIIDDGSTDKTCDVIKKYLPANGFIQLMNRKGNSTRDVGYGGIRAFNYGVQAIDPSKYDYIVNLDADVSFEPDYFERLFEKFNQFPKLGIAGGQRWSYRFGRLVLDKMAESHVSGATKVYRRDCYLDIHPIKELPSWDTVDELQAQRLGWETLSFSDIQIIHLKPMTLGAGDTLQGKFILGKTSYLIGYPPDFMILRSIKMMFEFPYLIGGALMLSGFLTALLSRKQILLDEDLVKYFRQKQRARIYKFLNAFKNQD